ncbi:MAG TPA: MOSC domain-containing protein [Candidatus Binatus sp.]|nr:MOSC domain-containing protein [Candidatus Binatus sp.]
MDASDVLSAALGRSVRLVGPADTSPERRVEWDDEMTFDSPPGAFFDLAPLHVLTTASLAAIADARPEARFDPRRFRPNVLIDCGPRHEFVEDAIEGKLLAIGDAVRVRAFMPTIRCALTTRAQEDLPADPTILRTIVEQHAGNLGLYATVETSGDVHLGDPVVVVDS